MLSTTALIRHMEITGPAADTVGPDLGPKISDDLPEMLAALVERAAADRAGG